MSERAGRGGNRGRLRAVPSPAPTRRTPGRPLPRPEAGRPQDSEPAQDIRDGRIIQDETGLPRGRLKYALIRDLAMGEWEPSSLTVKYELAPEEIMLFAETYAEEIAEVSQALAGHLDISTAGLWVTAKQKRLAEYQQAIEDIDQALQSMRNGGVSWSRSHRDLFRARMDIYRQVADELGAFPQRSQAPARQGERVAYVIETENEGDLT